MWQQRSVLFKFYDLLGEGSFEKNMFHIKNEHVSIVTSDYQIVHNYIVSLAIVSRAVFDANSAVGLVHFLQKNKRLIRQAIDRP